MGTFQGLAILSAKEQATKPGIILVFHQFFEGNYASFLGAGWKDTGELKFLEVYS